MQKPPTKRCAVSLDSLCGHRSWCYPTVVLTLPRRSYNLPDFRIHMTREQLFRMLHCADNEQLPTDLGKAKRFEAKLDSRLTGINTNFAQLLQLARGLSVDEMMVKFYVRSVVRQYMPSIGNTEASRAEQTSPTETPTQPAISLSQHTQP